MSQPKEQFLVHLEAENNPQTGLLFIYKQLTFTPIPPLFSDDCFFSVQPVSTKCRKIAVKWIW